MELKLKKLPLDFFLISRNTASCYCLVVIMSYALPCFDIQNKSIYRVIIIQK